MEREKESTSLINLDKAIVFIEKASVAQLEELISQSEAFRVYVIQAKKGMELQNRAVEIKLRAERKLSEWYKKEPKNRGGKPPVAPLQPVRTLKEMGLDKTKMHRINAIASLPEEAFEKHIKDVKASNEELTTVGVIKMARELNRKDVIFKKSAELPKGKYQVIYADPAWQYNNSGFDMSAEKQYPTMSTEKICELDIKNLADDNCVLFLWTTNPLLEDAFKVMSSWGFEYKTNFVWVKKNHTAGFYVYGQHELLLIGIRGSLLPTGEKPKSIVSGENKIHSKKPEIVYEIIEKMYPKSKYLELFARNTRNGWESWGNQI